MSGNILGLAKKYIVLVLQRTSQQRYFVVPDLLMRLHYEWSAMEIIRLQLGHGSSTH